MKITKKITIVLIILIVIGLLVFVSAMFRGDDNDTLYEGTEAGVFVIDGEDEDNTNTDTLSSQEQIADEENIQSDSNLEGTGDDDITESTDNSGSGEDSSDDSGPRGGESVLDGYNGGVGVAPVDEE